MSRVFSCIFVALLAIPLVGLGLSGPKNLTATDGRKLASAPALPASTDQWLDFPGAVKAFVADHFWGRDALRALDARAKMALQISSKPGIVTVGRDGWLYHLEVLGRDAAGFRQDTAPVAVAYYQHANDIASAAGIPMVMAMVPHKLQVYPEYLTADAWIQPPVYYQDILAPLLSASTSVEYLDLLPSLLEEKERLSSAGEPVNFRQDTHWNMLGANAAQFVIASALQDDLRITARKVPPEDFYLKPAHEPVFPGDILVNEFFSYESRLASLLGLRDATPEFYPLPHFIPNAQVSLVKQGRFRLLHSEEAPKRKVLVVHDSGSIGLAPYFSRYFSESLYWWTSAPSLLSFEQLVALYRPDAVIWQTSQNSIAAPGFKKILPSRLEEYESFGNKRLKNTDWKPVYRWQADAPENAAAEGNTATETTTQSNDANEPSHFSLELPATLANQVSGKRIKLMVSARLGDAQIFQSFGVNFSSRERQCICVRRLLVDTSMTKAQLIFDVPDKPVERDRIEIFPQLGASVSDLIIESIEVYTE